MVAVKSPWRCATTALSRVIDMRMSIWRGGMPQSIFVPDPRTITHSFSREAHSSTLPTDSAESGSMNTRGTTPSMASAGVPSRTASTPSSETAVSVINALGIRPFDRGELRVAVLVGDDFVADFRVVLEAISHLGFFVLESIRQLDGGAVLFSGHRILDRLDAEFAKAGDFQLGNALVAIARQLDTHVDRIEYG